MKKWQLLTAACAVLLLAVVGGPAAAAENRGHVPDTVKRALEPDGAVHRHVLDLNQRTTSGSRKTGTPLAQAQAEAAATTFGSPVRYAHLQLAEDGGSGDALTEADLGDAAPFYLSVEYVNSRPTSTVQVTETGEFAALGGFLPEEVTALAAVAPGRFEELYSASPDLTTVRALNPSATALVGGGDVAVSELRRIKARQWSEYVAALPVDVPEDAVGASVSNVGRGGSGGAWLPGVGIALLGAALVAASAFLLGRSSRSRQV